jgi:hypothetical protein
MLNNNLKNYVVILFQEVQKKYMLLIFALFFYTVSIAQPGTKTTSEGIITYAYRNNAKELKEAPPLQLYFKNNIAHLVQSGRRANSEDLFIDYNLQEAYQILTMKDGSHYILKTPFNDFEKATVLNDTATILGYHCQKAKLTIRSNTIEVWFTNEAGIKGSPSISVAPALGLILKMVRNGSFETYATSVELKKINDADVAMPANNLQVVDEATYRRKQIDNRFTTIPVFNHQQINFGDTISNSKDDEINTVYRYAGGTVVVKKMKLPAMQNALVFASLTEYSNGDAYDRTGSVFIIPFDKKINFLDALKSGVKVLPVYKDKQQQEYQGVVETKDYLPPLELMRFFTPFGVRHYNERSKIEGYNWADSVNYKQDITELLPRLNNEVWIGVYIGNYDKGGHIINLDLEYHEEEADSIKKQYWVQPVFNTLNLMEMAQQNYGTMFDDDSLTVTVNIPKGLKNAALRYIATGHGGWGGGDEFNKKLNEIFLDGRKIFEFIPWRTDCGTYRMFNPSSGNFGNGVSSSDYSRSNWCPGTTTNPVYIPLNDLAAGTHTLKVAIPLGKREGNSFSAWNISGCIIGEVEN